MKVIDVEQGTDAWHQARCGRVTASRISDVLAKLKSGGEAAGRKNYRAQLVVETLCGVPYPQGYVSAEMQRGTEQEPLACAAYQLLNDCELETVGFVEHPTIARAGASPDRLIGTNGLLECKCPNSATHLEYILADRVPSEYVAQMLFQMDVTEREFCDFVSYDCRLPAHLQLFIKRLPRDDIRIVEIRLEVEKFLAEVDDMIARLPREGESDPLPRQLKESLERAQAKHEVKVSGLTKLVEAGDKIKLENGEVVEVPF